jgi:hypothetical protein
MYPALYPALARNLAAQRTGAIVQVAWTAATFRVRHALDSDGSPLMLCRTGGALDRVLAEGDVAAVISVAGEMTVGDGKDQRQGRVWISGWTTPLHGAAAREAAIEFAMANPLSDLLGVNNGFCLHRLEPAEVRLDRDGQLVDVDLEAYLATSPADS